jgi:hypothetical protein
LGVASTLTKMGSKVFMGNRSKEDTIQLERQLAKLQRNRLTWKSTETKKAVWFLCRGVDTLLERDNFACFHLVIIIW